MNDKEDTVKISNRYYCKECGEQRQAEINKNTNGWDELYKYICDLYNIEQPTGMMFKQLKEFRDEPYNYTNTGMLLTLKYFYETLENEVKEDTGLGIIPYFYEKAKKHMVDIIKIHNHEVGLENTEKPKTVKIKKPINRKKERRTLSFNNIQWEEDLNEQEHN
jgi:hypothetical protein